MEALNTVLLDQPMADNMTVPVEDRFDLITHEELSDRIEFPFACYQVLLVLIIVLALLACYYCFPAVFEQVRDWLKIELSAQQDFVGFAERAKEVMTTMVMAS